MCWTLNYVLIHSTYLVINYGKWKKKFAYRTWNWNKLEYFWNDNDSIFFNSRANWSKFIALFWYIYLSWKRKIKRGWCCGEPSPQHRPQTLQFSRKRNHFINFQKWNDKEQIKSKFLTYYTYLKSTFFQRFSGGYAAVSLTTA